MKKFFSKFYLFLMFNSLLLLLPGCDFIGDVFKTGIWVGVIIIIAILAVGAFIFKMFKN